MAKKPTKTTSSFRSLQPKEQKKKRAGVHAKTKTSRLKRSKNYKKAYRGQGKWAKAKPNLNYTTTDSVNLQGLFFL